MHSWVCVFLSVNIFLCLPQQLSVCLCFHFGYIGARAKNCLSLNIVVRICVIKNPATSDILVDSLIVIFRKELVWIEFCLLSCGAASGNIVYLHSP